MHSAPPMFYPATVAPVNGPNHSPCTGACPAAVTFPAASTAVYSGRLAVAPVRRQPRSAGTKRRCRRVVLRGGLKLLLAPARAEVVGRARMLQRGPQHRPLLRVQLHSAHRISCHAGSPPSERHGHGRSASLSGAPPAMRPPTRPPSAVIARCAGVPLLVLVAPPEPEHD